MLSRFTRSARMINQVAKMSQLSTGLRTFSITQRYHFDDKDYEPTVTQVRFLGYSDTI